MNSSDTPTNPSDASENERRDLLRFWVPIVLLVVAGFGIAISQLDPPPPRELRLAAGSPGGAYHAYALQYRDFLAQEGFQIEVVETGGSLDNLERLSRGEVEVAFVQGGTWSGPEEDGLELISLGSIFLEPLWVFHRADLPLEQLRELEGQRLAIGGPKSGTRALVQAMLESNGISPENTTLLEIGGMEAAEQLLAGEVDAVFFVAAAGADTVKHLAAAQGVQLLSITRDQAYRTRYRFLSPHILGEGTLDLAQNLPPEDTRLLASAASLVTHEKLNDALVPLLVQAATQIHRPGGMFEQPGAFPSAEHSEIPVSPTAAHLVQHGPSFLFRVLPFHYAASIDRLKILLLPFITLLIPIFRIAPPLYRWRIRRRIFRWYEDLKLVDEVLRADRADLADLEPHKAALQRMEREVTEVQVPLSYMDEFYRLRIHIALILAKLRHLEERSTEQDVA